MKAGSLRASVRCRRSEEGGDADDGAAFVEGDSL